MRRVVAGLLWIVCGCDGGGSDFTDVCPTEIEPGASCAVVPEADCVIDNNDCRLAEVCNCTATGWQCSAVDFDSDCSGLQNADCPIEGNYGCEIYPISGVRSCVDGAWYEDSSCPEGCPEEVQPDDGDPCTASPGEPCPYGDVECWCIGGMFGCDPA